MLFYNLDDKSKTYKISKPYCPKLQDNFRSPERKKKTYFNEKTFECVQ